MSCIQFQQLAAKQWFTCAMSEDQQSLQYIKQHKTHLIGIKDNRNTGKVKINGKIKIINKSASALFYAVIYHNKQVIDELIHLEQHIVNELPLIIEVDTIYYKPLELKENQIKQLKLPQGKYITLPSFSTILDVAILTGDIPLFVYLAKFVDKQVLSNFNCLDHNWIFYYCYSSKKYQLNLPSKTTKPFLQYITEDQLDRILYSKSFNIVSEAQKNDCISILQIIFNIYASIPKILIRLQYLCFQDIKLGSQDQNLQIGVKCLQFENNLLSNSFLNEVKKPVKNEGGSSLLIQVNNQSDLEQSLLSDQLYSVVLSDDLSENIEDQSQMLRSTILQQSMNLSERLNDVFNEDKFNSFNLQFSSDSSE